jgi:hypothetical protein
LHEAFESPDLSPTASNLALAVFHLSLSVSDFSHAMFDLSPVAVTKDHAKVHTCHAPHLSVLISVSTSSGAMLNGSMAKV